AVAIFDVAARRAVLAIDRFSIRTLCYSIEGQRIAFSDRADAVPVVGAPILDRQALYDYFYFHLVPAPRTIFPGIRRLTSGFTLSYRDGTCNVFAHWTPQFEERNDSSFGELKSEFRQLIRDAVSAEARDCKVGCFLSGGTDSSTVAGTLCAVTR